MGLVRPKSLKASPEILDYRPCRTRLVARHRDSNRAFVRVLELALLHPLDLVSQAVAEAVERGAFQVEAVQQLLERHLAPPATPPPLDPARYPALPHVQLAPVAVTTYNQLLSGTQRAAAGRLAVAS